MLVLRTLRTVAEERSTFSFNWIASVWFTGPRIHRVRIQSTCNFETGKALEIAHNNAILRILGCFAKRSAELVPVAMTRARGTRRQNKNAPDRSSSSSSSNELSISVEVRGKIQTILIILDRSADAGARESILRRGSTSARCYIDIHLFVKEILSV